MEGLQKKKGKRPNLFDDTVFSWSLDDVHNERLFKNKARKNLCSAKNNDIVNKGLVRRLSSGLNKSQTGTVLACHEMLHSRESAVGKGTDLFCSLGEILLFGNKGRLKIGSDIEEIYMDCRVKRLVECLGPSTGWRHCFASMIGLLEDCVSDYHIFLENDHTNKTELNNVSDMKDIESRRGAQVKKGKCKTFVEFFRNRFTSTAAPLRYCSRGWDDSNQNLSIGIVTPYAAQVVTIEEKLGQRYNNLDGFIVKVKTIDGFHGGEEDIFIFSTGRSNCHQSLHIICNWTSSYFVLFSDKFLKSFKKLMSVSLKSSVLNVLLKLASGWRPKMQSSDSANPSLVKKFKVEDLYIVCTTDISKDLGYIQVLRIWDILPIQAVPTLVNRLDIILNKNTHEYINLCMGKCLEGDLEVPISWPSSLQFLRFKELNLSEIQSNLVGDPSDGRSYAENSWVSESLLLMKFYSLSSAVVDYLLSDHEGRELDLPFEVTDQEMEIILFRRRSFIVGRSGTGKTTVLTMKLFQKDQWHQLAVRGCHISESSTVEQNSAATEGKVLRQLFVIVSPKLCYAIKQQVLHLKRFASGRSVPTETSLIDMVDFDEDEAQFNELQDSFHEVPPHSYPLFITLHKFLIMLDGTLGNSYFERFLDVTEVTNGLVRSSRSIALQTFIRTKEVTFEKFSSLYWPHFNTELTKKLDGSRVFTEIISHIKGGLGALDASDGKCSRDCYVKMSNRASNLSEEIRENIYRIFQTYEKLKMEYGEFDLADFVTDLQHRLRHGKYKGYHMDFVYIDEVRDLRMSQIALFKHVCHNVEEGFVFSGDTAQTIARGIDFRFQELRHLFYKKFVLVSRSNKHDESKEKGQISEILHLTQNFRTHAGILKLSQSIVELLYRLFPESIDVLKPESSLIYEEAPILLESGENENAITKIFGNSGNVVGFGAEQVILVRDDSARNEIANLVGKHALVLTIVECKGLEFQDVLLYNFFGSSPSRNHWRVIYDFMNELDLLDHTLPRGFSRFNVAKHNILYKESVWETLVFSDSVLFQDSFHEVPPQYIKGSCHGTTIFWVHLGDRVIVGVDSQQTQEFIGDESVHYRRFDLMMSGEDKKFLKITNEVYATLCGDKKRCFMMLDDVTLLNHVFVECMQVYAVNQGVAVPTEPTLMDVVEFAWDFFLKNPMNDPTEKESTVNLCAWMPLLEEYQIIVVGDSYKEPKLMTQTMFGCGSGSSLGVIQLAGLELINEDIVLHELTTATTRDPHTGGFLDVWTLFRGTCTLSRRDRLINRLHYSVYANMLFEGKSIFVIIRDTDGTILSPLDLLAYLSRFDTNIIREDILWLCFPLGYIVYHVRLSSQDCCDRWFESCREYRQPIRRQRYTNLENKCCNYYLAYATIEMFNRAQGMQFFYDLADGRV